MSVVGVIPARLKSRRLDRKVLLDLCGKPVIQHVYERAKEATQLDEVIVACDDPTILNAVKRFGGKAVLTSRDHVSGTDRLAEAAERLDVKWVVNIQGDEPLMNPRTIDELVKLMQEDTDLPMGTVVKKSSSLAEFKNPNVVKAVLDKNNTVIYFSRSPIPSKLNKGESFYKHLGIYAYTKTFLMGYKQLVHTALEKAENLEQLRALENGFRIRAIETAYESIGIDTQEDLEHVRSLMTKERV